VMGVNTQRWKEKAKAAGVLHTHMKAAA